MEYLTASQLAKRWRISEQMVRRYCKEGRIDNAYFKDGAWFIEKGQKKPKRKKYGQEEIVPVQPEPPALLQELRKQQEGSNNKRLYDYIQINMAYSNNRMASGRMTCEQIERLYHADKIFTKNEELKVNDVIEARNSFICLDYILDEAMTQLNQAIIQSLHIKLRANTVGAKRVPQRSGLYRVSADRVKDRTKVIPLRIAEEVEKLFVEYEKQERSGLEEILDLHVRFERIHPFEDCNGRIGRLIVFKECLRHEITPFIIDDKRRRRYLQGIECWKEDKKVLLAVCKEAQERFLEFSAVSRLLEKK